KLCVLAAALGYEGVAPEQVDTHGIAHATPEDLRAARLHGWAVKMVAELEIDDRSHVRLRVGPALVPRDHAIASVRDEQNIFVIPSDLAGTLPLAGRGAGPRATVSALLGDVCRAVGHGAAISASPSMPRRCAATLRPVAADSRFFARASLRN